jgi:predicted dehydrogenase
LSKVRLALLGCGDVAQRDYLPELDRIADRAELVAVCGRTEARVRAVAEAYRVPTWYTDAPRMLAESGADAVVNLTPMQLHAETTLAALRAGKHVYTEKPAAGSAAEARALGAEARALGLVLVCAPSVMLFPQVGRAAALLAGDAVGPVYSARGHGHGGVPPWPGYRSDPTPYFAPGGGPALDMGVYPLHALTGLLGPVRRVAAMASRTRAEFVVGDGPAAGRRVPIQVDDNWHFALDFGGGRLASLEASNCVRATRAAQLELYGLDGTIAVDLLDVSAPLGLFRPAHGWEEIAVPHARARGPDHLLGVEHLVECIRTGQPPALSIEHAAHVLDVVEQAGLAARDGSARAVAPWEGQAARFAA